MVPRQFRHNSTTKLYVLHSGPSVSPGSRLAVPDHGSSLALLAMGAGGVLADSHIVVTVVPEPASLALLGMAGAALVVRRRRRA